MVSGSGRNCLVPHGEKAKKNFDGMKVYKTKFIKEWMKEIPVFPANENEYVFYYRPCEKNVSCRHQDFSDIQRHTNSTSHINMTKVITDNWKVFDMPAPSTREAELHDEVTRAEV